LTAHDSRPAIPDISAEQEELGLTFKTIGGVLLVFDCLVSVYIPIGLRDGSHFWVVWAVVQAMIGLAFVAYGLWLEHQATSRVGSVHVSTQTHTS
jgi:hypothetical protein